VEAALAAEEPALLAAEARILNEARLRLLALRTARLASATAAAFELAERRLTAIASGERDADRWAAAVRRLVVETAALVGSGTIRVRPSDLAVARAALDGGALAGLTVEADPGMPAGVSGRSADGRVTVDATIEARLRRARASLVPDVAARLQPATGGAGGERRVPVPAGARA
jgi:vacuolar-type H+-ATPase subunit E/Vma4